MCVYMYVYIYIYIYICLLVYITYRERERERDRDVYTHIEMIPLPQVLERDAEAGLDTAMAKSEIAEIRRGFQRIRRVMALSNL